MMFLGWIFRSIQYKRGKMFRMRNADQTTRISLIMSLGGINSGNDEFRQFYVLFLFDFPASASHIAGTMKAKAEIYLAITILGETPPISASRGDRNYSFRWFDFLRFTGNSFHAKERYDRFRIAWQYWDERGKRIGFDCDLVIISYYLVILQTLNV